MRNKHLSASDRMPDAWHARRLQWCLDNMATAEHRYTDDELRAIRSALDYPPPYDEIEPAVSGDLFAT